MTLDQATELIRHTLLLALLVSAPMLLIGLVVGIIASFLQSITQIQEQALSFIPKFLATMAVAIVLMPWMGQHVIEYARQLFAEGLLR